MQIYSARPTAENHFINTDWGLKIGVEIKSGVLEKLTLPRSSYSLASCNHFDSQAIKSLKGTVQTMALSL